MKVKDLRTENVKGLLLAGALVKQQEVQKKLQSDVSECRYREAKLDAEMMVGLLELIDDINSMKKIEIICEESRNES